MSNVEYQPAEKYQIRLMRPDPSTPWGFRLQGGVDFNTPLSIQSVNPGSVSERCGLKAGDAILSINNATSDAMAHDDAKAEIMRSGNEIFMLVERGAVKIWKPQVTPLNQLRPQELRTIQSATGDDVQAVQKTSLAINKPPDEPCRIGSGHNRTAQPFGAPKAAVPNVVHSQYNSPMGLYSAGNIADSYSQQTAGIQHQMQNDSDNSDALKNMDLNDVPTGTKISGGGQILEQELPVEEGGENVVKPSSDSTSTTTSSTFTTSTTFNPARPRDSSPAPSAPQGPTQSAVYEEHEGDTPQYKGFLNPSSQSRTFKHLQEQMAAEEENNNSGGGGGQPGFRSVSAPVAKPPSERPQQPSMKCGGCDMLATGVIVKANGVPYHVGCFKCASCSMNLKQKGFFVVDGKLYCETHAKRHAKPPGPDMVAVASYR